MNTRATQRRELGAFLFLMVVAAPALTLLVVGSYGLVVWIWQIINGPPGPAAP
jgi:nitrate reductase NapE